MKQIYSPTLPRLSTPIPLKLKDDLKIAAVKRGKHMQALVQKILEEWLEANSDEEEAA